MNCKAGDLAIVVKAGPYAGRLVECLYLAPMGISFTLPNGQRHYAITDGLPSWVVNVLGSPIECAFGNGSHRKPVMQGATSDIYLRPLPGELEQETVDEAATV